MAKPIIAMIAAVDANLSLARADGTFLWPHIESDVNFYRQKIRGHTVVMGSTTYKQQSVATLRQVHMVVLSRQSREDLNLPKDVKLISNLKDVFMLEPATEDNTIFIAGGGKVYSELLPDADILYLSEIAKAYEDPGDNVKFPKFDKNEWEVTEEIPHTDEEVPFTIRTYKRKP